MVHLLGDEASNSGTVKMRGQRRNHSLKTGQKSGKVQEEEIPEKIFAEFERKLFRLGTPTAISGLADVDSDAFEFFLAPGELVVLKKVGHITDEERGPENPGGNRHFDKLNGRGLGSPRIP